MTALKYDKILSREYLEKKYVTGLKTIYEIAEELEESGIPMNPHMVYDYLRMYGMSRTKKETHALRLRSKTPCALLRDEYEVKEKSAGEISKLVGVGDDFIYTRLRECGLKVRGKSEATHYAKRRKFSLTPMVKDYIDGLVLSDGHIRGGKWAAAYQQAFALDRVEWCEKVKDDLRSFGIDTVIYECMSSEHYVKGKRIRACSYINLRSYFYEELKDFRDRWYYNGVKVIPRDINFSPALVGNWYLGDGCLCSTNFLINLSTNCFSLPDINWVSKGLDSRLGIISRVNKKKEIVIPRCYAKRFLAFIETSKVDCFRYKWALSEYQASRCQYQ